MKKFLRSFPLAGSVSHWLGASFTRHNKRIWKRKRRTVARREILIEFNRWNPLIGMSYLTNILADEFQSKVSPFVASPKRRKFLNRSFLIALVRVGYFLSFFPEAKAYKSFGSGKVIVAPRKSAHISLEARKISDTFFGGCRSKKDLETFEIQNIVIGDLIYDTFLRQQGIPTLDIADSRFQMFFRESVEDFLFWLDYVTPERVGAVVTSHAVYDLAFPLRVAAAKGISSFVAGSEAIYRISTEGPHAGQEFLEYPEFFETLSPRKKEKILDSADEVLRNRFHGLIGPNSDITEASARLYRRRKEGHALSRTTNTKVLVALHAFSDSPHSGGGALFPDFWEWTKYLAEWSVNSPYEWYIKNHPDLFRGDRPFVESLVKQYPHLRVLPEDVSHHQLIQEGVSVVLTVRGTIGFEYALQGVPVINASRTNPHMRYSFNHHPQTIEQLNTLLLRLQEITRPSKHDRELARQYFAVKNYLSKKRLFIQHLGGDSPFLGPHRARANSKLMRSRFVKTFEESRHIVHARKVRDFVESGEYFLR